MIMMKVNYAMVVFLLGFVGLVLSFTNAQDEISSKIPLAIFFIVVMCVGIALQVAPKDIFNDKFGEMDGNRDFG